MSEMARGHHRALELVAAIGCSSRSGLKKEIMILTFKASTLSITVCDANDELAKAAAVAVAFLLERVRQP